MMQTGKNIKSILAGCLFLLVMQMASCKKFLEVEAPSTSVNEENVYKTDATAIAVLTDIYSRIQTGTFSGKDGISVLTGLSSDELTLANNVTDVRLLAYYRNQLTAGVNANYGIDYWTNGLQHLFTCNAAIEGLSASSALTPAVKIQLLGEAKFMRALFYFYLVNLYGDVPLVLTTNPNINRILPRSPQSQVYEQIVNDLKDAQNLLSNSFLNAALLSSTSERIRPTSWAATALLARTYLYMKQYAAAEAEASKIIANTSQFSLAPVNNVFLKNSSEAIWQLQPVQVNTNTPDAVVFKLPSSGPNRNNNPVYLSTQLLNAFETGDVRRKPGGWIDSVIVGGTTYFFPAKYRATVTSGAPTEYLVMFRLAEQYLVRAEARANQNNVDGAKEDLDVIRTRASLPGTLSNDHASMIAAIITERQLEFFTELGHRWFDLKRTGMVNEVMSTVTPLKASQAAWNAYQQLYPITFNDIQKNQNLTQNIGY